MKTRRKPAPISFDEILTTELASFIVNSNRDLIKAVIMEDYEQAALIQSAIYLTLEGQAELIAESSKQSLKYVYDLLLEQNKYVFDLMSKEAFTDTE